MDKVFIGDANNEDLVKEAVLSSIENGEGRLDGVAHMVGSFAVRPPHAMSVDSFEDVIRTNLTSAFVTLSIACKQMLRNGGGRVVFTSSVAGSLGLVNHEAVSAAKGGVEATDREHGHEVQVAEAEVIGAVNPERPFPITESAMDEADGGETEFLLDTITTGDGYVEILTNRTEATANRTS